MNGHVYQSLALRTESHSLPLVGDPHDSRLLHAGIGLATEAGEFLDPLKKFLFYGKSVDKTNLKEEIGDMLWYIAIACDALDTTISLEMERNIHKLRTRYPEKFTEEQANERDLDAERNALESHP